MFYAPIYAGVDPEDGAPMWYVPGENPDETTMNETTKEFDKESLTQNTGKRYHAPISVVSALQVDGKDYQFRLTSLMSLERPSSTMTHTSMQTLMCSLSRTTTSL
jgi:hypothetical protein